MPSTRLTQNGNDAGRPRLAPHVRLGFDKARGRPVLLAPESVTVLNSTGVAIVHLCDGTRTADDIVAELRERYSRVDGDEVREFIGRLMEMRCLRAES
jgi:pyrroloquinoline quinone biosynthesis protein D